MRRSFRTAACLLMAAVVVSASLLVQNQAAAAVVEIVVSSPQDANATTAATNGQDSIVDRALRQAVIDAAHSILPAPIDNSRRAMLDRMLADRTTGFVVSYSELESREENGTVVRVFDVQVNNRSLKQWLRQLGLFATAHFDLGYSRSIQGASAEQIQNIDQLAMLMGLDQRPGVKPKMTIAREGDAWKGTLDADSGALNRSSESLPSVWLALWGEYFAGRYEQDPLLAAAAANGLGEEALADARGRLTVRGWTSLDAVEAFDVQLKSWPAEVQNVVFGDMHFGAKSITATWSLTAKQPNALKQRIDEYIAGRNLSYTLALEAPPEPASGLVNATAGAESAPADPVIIEGESAEVADQLDDALQDVEQDASKTIQQGTDVDDIVDSLADSITNRAGDSSQPGRAVEPAPSQSPEREPGAGESSGYGPRWRDQGGAEGETPLH
ncbi:hypothetical protein [Oceanidesulfovibrio indonesiensis]|nr:hypothetical protein [Oceanidesulfovibrio indonesiensis]